MLGYISEHHRFVACLHFVQDGLCVCVFVQVLARGDLLLLLLFPHFGRLFVSGLEVQAVAEEDGIGAEVVRLPSSEKTQLKLSSMASSSATSLLWHCIIMCSPLGSVNCLASFCITEFVLMSTREKGDDRVVENEKLVIESHDRASMLVQVLKQVELRDLDHPNRGGDHDRCLVDFGAWTSRAPHTKQSMIKGRETETGRVMRGCIDTMEMHEVAVLGAEELAQAIRRDK